GRQTASRALVLTRHTPRPAALPTHPQIHGHDIPSVTYKERRTRKHVGAVTRATVGENHSPADLLGFGASGQPPSDQRYSVRCSERYPLSLQAVVLRLRNHNAEFLMIADDGVRGQPSKGDPELRCWAKE